MSIIPISIPYDSNLRAQELIKKDQIDQLLIELPEMHGLGLDIVEVLIDKGKQEELSKDIGSFQANAHPEISKRLIDSGEAGQEALLVHLSKFKQMNHYDVFVDLMEAGAIENMLKYFGEFEQFTIEDKKRAIELLVENGHAEEVEKFKKFIGYLRVDFIRCEPTEGGEQIEATVRTSTYVDPNGPTLHSKMALDICVGKTKYSGNTPQETIAAMQSGSNGGSGQPALVEGLGVDKDDLTPEIIIPDPNRPVLADAAQLIASQVAFMALKDTTEACFPVR